MSHSVDEILKQAAERREQREVANQDKETMQDKLLREWNKATAKGLGL